MLKTSPTPKHNDNYFARILIVEDDSRLCRSLHTTLRPYADEIRACGTIEEAVAVVFDWQPDMMLLDFKLADGDALELLTAISHRSPYPAIIALSAYAQPYETFELARFGVRAYLQKPISLPDLESALERVLVEPPNLTPHIRSAVGAVGLKKLESSIRQTMLEEALSRTNGSRRGAAKLLDVSRQFVQHVLNKYEIL